MNKIKIIRDGIQKHGENAQGFTLIELLVVIAIIGVLSAVAIPKYNELKNRSYDADAKTNLRNVYTACKAYWTDNGTSQACSVSAAAGATYGYIQSAKVTITATGNENTFSATAQHSSGNSYTINASGTIN